MEQITPPGKHGKLLEKCFANRHLSVGWTERWEHADYPAVWRFSKNPSSLFLSEYIIKPCLEEKNLRKLHIL